MSWDLGEISFKVQREAVLAMADRMGEQSIDGVLLGRRDPNDSRTLLVNLCLPVNALYWTESRSLSDSENRTSFERTLSRFERAGNSAGVVGYFRADSGIPPVATEDDRRLMKDYFSNPPGVFLSIGSRRGSVVCALASWQDGEIVQQALPVHSPAPKPHPIPEQRSRRHRALVPALIFLVLLVAASAAGIWKYRQPVQVPTSPAPANRSLDLRVERAGPDLRLTWDRTVASSFAQPQALLSIIDGGGTKQVVITPELLIGGSLVYSPRTGDILFLFDIVVAGERKLSGSARYLSFGAPIDEAPPAEVEARMPNPPLPAPRPPVAAPRIFVPSILQKRGAEVRLDVLDPPQIVTGNPGIGSAAAGALKEITQLHSAAIPSPKTSNLPLSTVISPPQVYRQVRVVVPPELRPMMHKDVEIEIKAFIDAAGKVYKTQPLTSTDGYVMAGLTKAAEEASRKWQFVPARRDGQVLPSEMVLHYKITRPRQ